MGPEKKRKKREYLQKDKKTPLPAFRGKIARRGKRKKGEQARRTTAVRRVSILECGQGRDKKKKTIRRGGKSPLPHYYKAGRKRERCVPLLVDRGLSEEKERRHNQAGAGGSVSSAECLNQCGESVGRGEKKKKKKGGNWS